MKQKLASLLCAIFGHSWETFNTLNASRSIADRTYCSRCGIKYHTHTFRRINKEDQKEEFHIDPQVRYRNLTEYLKKTSNK